MATAEAVDLANRPPVIFARRIPLCEVVPPHEITDRLELTRLGTTVEGISHPLVETVKKNHWYSVDKGRIYIEVLDQKYSEAHL